MLILDCAKVYLADCDNHRLNVVRRIRDKHRWTLVTAGLQQRVDSSSWSEDRVRSTVARSRYGKSSAQRHAFTESNSIAFVAACSSTTVPGAIAPITENAREHPEAPSSAAAVESSTAAPSGKTLHDQFRFSHWTVKIRMLLSVFQLKEAVQCQKV